MNDDTTARLARAIDRAKQWMNANEAPLLVENLADGCSAEAIAEAEKKLGFALPPQLAALWSLHDGQHDELNGFIESYDLFGVAFGTRERDRILRRYVRSMLGDSDDAREGRERAGLLENEVSERWIPFAGRDADFLAVNADSGRVFWLGKDFPPMALRAESLVAFFEVYANGMDKGVYTVEEGFGDYYLQGE